MNSKGHKTAAIVELIALFAALVFVCVTVTRVFVMCRSRSIEAAALNDSVLLASSAAEIASASDDMESLRDAMASADSTAGSFSRYEPGKDEGSGTVWVLAEAPDGRQYVVRVIRGAAKTGRYRDDRIDVFGAADAQDAGDIDWTALDGPIYTLSTGSRCGEEAVK